MAMPAHWETNLLEALLAKTPAPLYIIRPAAREQWPSECLDSWAKNLSVAYLSGALGVTEQMAQQRLRWGHPDLMTLRPPSSGQNYKMEDGDLAPLFHSQAHRPLELPCRLILVFNAEKIGENYANKMLKTLEEPQADTVVFLLVGGQHRLLATVESRALSLRLPAPAGDGTPEGPPSPQAPLEEVRRQWFVREWQRRSESMPEHRATVEAWLERPLHTHALVEALKKGPALQKLFVGMVVDWHCTPFSPAAHKSAILEELRWFQRAGEFHNAPGERLLGLIHATFTSP